MATSRLHARAPTRIDLAGGTLDLWPLHLFLDRPSTVNLGIDLFAEADLRFDPQGADRIRLRSGDQGADVSLSWRELASYSAPPALDLHAKLLRHFAAGAGHRSTGELTLETRAKSPSGAGLGGSSTLSIAMIGVLASWAQGRRVDAETEGEKLIEVARDVETTVIQVPAGLQDYYGAMFGGLQSLRWGVSNHGRRKFPAEVLAGLERRLLLFYSGQSRNSGINNWALYKSFIDRQADVRERFAGIALATRELETALDRLDWTAAGEAIAREWEIRRTLAAGISTPAMNEAFALAQALAPVSGKICGAGGGGCFFLYASGLADAGGEALRAKLIEAVTASGIQSLPFRATPTGLTIEETRDEGPA